MANVFGGRGGTGGPIGKINNIENIKNISIYSIKKTLYMSNFYFTQPILMRFSPISILDVVESLIHTLCYSQTSNLRKENYDFRPLTNVYLIKNRSS